MSSVPPSSQVLLQFTLARAHQRFLPLLGQRLSAEDGALAPISNVLLTSRSLSLLRDVLELPTVRTGLLFGHRTPGALSVTHAFSGGYGGSPGLFTIDANYALGVTDALRQVDAGLDWVGQWLTVPGDAFVQARQRLAWVEMAQAEGLIGPHYPLVMVGWREGGLVAESVIGLDGGEEAMPIRTRLQG